jgi:hypothetical protein
MITTKNKNIACVNLGDWIIKEDVIGYYYPVTNDDFNRKWRLKNDNI